MNRNLLSAMIIFMDNFNSLICFEDFCSQLEKETDWAILVGNGLGLSHYNEKINSIYDFKSFGLIDIQNIFKELEEHIKRDPDRIQNPEGFLDLLHTEAAFTIFKHYQKRDISNILLDENKEKLREFLKKFKSGIFCLNYDHLLYQCIFEDTKTQFADGFMGEKWVSSKKIEKVLKSRSIPLYYLHGAYMLLCRKSEGKKEYSKISATKAQKRLHKAIEDKFQEIIDQYRVDLKVEENFLLVLAPKSPYKRAIIEENEYLNFCFNKLKEYQKIFTYGCSFEKDWHLLEEIFTPLEVGKKEIRIGSYSDADKERVETWVKKGNYDTSKIDWKFVCTKNAGLSIWGSFPTCPPLDGMFEK